MFDLNTLHELSLEAAAVAAKAAKVPLTITQEDLDLGNDAIRRIPNLGNYLPDGWKREHLEDAHGVYDGDNDGFGAYFVDSSGWGGPGEAALGLGELIELIEPGFGYAIVEEGQFQIKIGKFARTH